MLCRSNLLFVDIFSKCQDKWVCDRTRHTFHKDMPNSECDESVAIRERGLPGSRHDLHNNRTSVVNLTVIKKGVMDRCPSS